MVAEGEFRLIVDVVDSCLFGLDIVDTKDPLMPVEETHHDRSRLAVNAVSCQVQLCI